MQKGTLHTVVGCQPGSLMPARLGKVDSCVRYPLQIMDAGDQLTPDLDSRVSKTQPTWNRDRARGC